MNQALLDKANFLLYQATRLIDEQELINLRTQLSEQESQTFQADFWQKPEAQGTLRRISGLKKRYRQLSRVQTKL